MPRLRKKHLPHRVTITRLTGEGAEGQSWATPEPAVPAYVEQKSKLVVDRRSTSETANKEIIADTFVVLLTSDDTLPGSKITVWEGTPREREAEVVTSALLDYKGTPSHVEAWLT